jgi:hypothetical protein
LLHLTGPVTVPSWDEPITAENAERVLLLDQYAQPASAVRGEFQGEVAEAVWAKLTTGDLASADELVDLLAPAVRGRRLQVFSSDAEAEAFFTRVDAAGVIAPVRGDYLGVVTQNLGGNKIDWFLRREVSYDLEYDPDSRRASGTVRIVLHNDAPSEGYSPLVIGSIEGFTTQSGSNRTWLNVYSALRVRDATVDGQPLTLLSGQELGRNVYWSELVLAPGSTTTIELAVEGTLDAAESGDSYHLDILGQPVVGNDRLSVTLRSGGQVVGGQQATPQEGNVAFDVPLHSSR